MSLLSINKLIRPKTPDLKLVTRTETFPRQMLEFLNDLGHHLYLLDVLARRTSLKIGNAYYQLGVATLQSITDIPTNSEQLHVNIMEPQGRPICEVLDIPLCIAIQSLIKNAVASNLFYAPVILNPHQAMIEGMGDKYSCIIPVAKNAPYRMTHAAAN